MSSVARSLLALLLMLAAVASALGGVAAQWLDRTARTPEPLQTIVGSLASDTRVREAMAAELTTGVIAQLPPGVDQLPGVRAQLEALITQAIDETLAGEDLAEAWDEAIDVSRADFVAALDRMRSGGDAPTLWLHLGPFVELGGARLVEISPEALRPLVAQVPLPDDLRIALGRPDTVQAGYAADMLALARQWAWFYVAAGVLAVLGLAVGSRRGRWVAWLLAAGAGLLVVVVGRDLVAGRAGAASGESVSSVVQAALVDGTVASLLEWTAPVATVGWVLLGLGVAALILAAVLRRQR